ncbi:hypothetical protein B0H14DRAFT_3644018 [Mycena olivaceomarginata]|nr:hypothetical protein B0H14DRAFT_3644018 [Mycena olivaceomarginata]
MSAKIQARAERCARLKEKYNFSCRCPTCSCSLPAPLLSKSDATRAELRAFSDGGASPFEVWCLDARMPDDVLIAIHKRTVALIESEGLQVLQRKYGRHLDAISWV